MILSDFGQFLWIIVHEFSLILSDFEQFSRIIVHDFWLADFEWTENGIYYVYFEKYERF